MISEPWSINCPNRRTKEQMEELRDGIYRLLEERHPMTCRQLFYQMVSAEMIPKTEASYKNIVVRLCGEMREADKLPWEWLADSTRWMHKPRSYSSLEEAVALTAQTYRRALWNEQDAYVEVWCEKEALGNILYEITSEFDVPLMIVRGFPSKDFVHSAAVAVEARGNPAYIYYFGDYDPSGLKIWVDTQSKIERYAPDAQVHFEKVGVTKEQIVEYALPTRPTKITKNTHAKGWKADEESVEVDALPVDVLQDLVRDAIERHIDQHQFEITKHARSRNAHCLVCGGCGYALRGRIENRERGVGLG